MRPVEALLRRYARGQARDVVPWIVGRRILDLGAGEGYLAAGLVDGERTICGVDVGLFRQAALPYVVYDGVPSTYSSDRLTPRAAGIRDGDHPRVALPPPYPGSAAAPSGTSVRP
jgi:hypothetical protein